MMDYRMLITYIIVDIFCIIIVSVILKSLTNDYGSEQEVGAFRHSLYCYIVFMISGLVGLILENGTSFYSKGIDYLANALSLSCLVLPGFFWLMFVLLRTNKRFVATRWRYLVYIPAYVVLFLCMSSPFTGLVFYIDQDNIYRRGPLFMVVSAISTFYMLTSTIVAYISAFRETRPSKKREGFLLGSFIYFPLIATILQVLLSGMPILAPAIAAAYYMVFSSMQGEMIYNDALTGMNNRRRAIFYLEERLMLVSQSSPLTVFMLDGNKFKLINDTYGHIEGDAAIVCIADAVQKVCGKYNLFGARYGGDEFILIGTDAKSSDMAVEDEINHLLYQTCEAQKKPYMLSVTVGHYTTTDNAYSVDDLITRADMRLYDRKRCR